MNNEKIIPNYLEATENILTSFRFNRLPHADDVSIVTMQTKRFTSALREIYFSDNNEKDNYYEVIYNVISKATFHICRENFKSDAYTDTWRAIVFSLELAERHIRELHFKESNKIYPFPKDKITTLSTEIFPNQSNVNKAQEQKPEKFEELFHKPELITPYVDVLKELDPPQIDTENNYIGKLKGIICVWIDELQRQGIVKHYSDRKIFASLIPQKIKRFSIDESMFAKHHKKAERNYRTDIKTKVSKIKLSQNSQ